MTVPLALLPPAPLATPPASAAEAKSSSGSGNGLTSVMTKSFIPHTVPLKASSAEVNLTLTTSFMVVRFEKLPCAVWVPASKVASESRTHVLGSLA